MIDIYKYYSVSLGLDPIDVGKYIISRCAKCGRPVSNFKANLLLYFVWVDYYKETGKMLFTNEFSATHAGPIFIPFYHIHACWGGMLIDRKYRILHFDLDTQLIIDNIIDRYLMLSAGQLYCIARRPNSPWDIIYRNGQGNKDPIPLSLVTNSVK